MRPNIHSTLRQSKILASHRSSHTRTGRINPIPHRLVSATLNPRISRFPTPRYVSAITNSSGKMAVPKTMKAIIFEKTGGPEVIQLKEIPVPTPGPNEVLVKVQWAGVNFIDTYFRGGLYPVELPKTLGNESAGTVVALGSSLKAAEVGYDVGDLVTSYGAGAMAEYAVSAVTKVAKVPEGVSAKDAATLLLQGLTALTMTAEAYEVKKGDWILVHAAAGGLGLLFCQIASHIGAHVIGTTSTEAKAEIAKKNGAEHVILYGEGRAPVSDTVLQLTGGEGVHAIFDGVGKDTWEDNFQSIRRKGTICSCGNASGAAPPFSALKLATKNVKVCRPRLDNYVFTLAEWNFYTEKLFALHKVGAVSITRYSEDGYPFSAEGVRQAHEDIAGRKTTGKLVVKIS